MPKVTFIDSDGQPHSLDAGIGASLMEVAVKNMVPGIDADCGGACACATCHVYVETSWLPKLNPKDDMESSMLDFAEDVKENSRLSCQITLTENLDGIVVLTPKTQ